MKVFVAAALAAVSTFALAQAPGAMVVGATPATPMLRAGMDVPLKTKTMLTTKGKKLRVGERFDLEVAEPISLNGQTVIPVGSRAVGEVTAVRNKGMWGKSGNIDGRILYVLANDRQIRLSGALNDKGTTGTAGVVGAIAVLPLAGFFMTGTSAAIPAGTMVMAHLDEDVPVAFVGGAGPAPMAVATTGPVEATVQPAVLNK